MDLSAAAEAKPAISVALCTCNGARFLEQQLESLARQTHPPVELIASDDASEDDSVVILERFANKALFEMRILRRTKRIGHGENFLQAARQCRGDWVAFADQDDVWFDGKLEEAAEVVRAHPSVLLVNQRSLLCEESLFPRCSALFPPERSPGLHRTPHLGVPLVWSGFLMTFSSRLVRAINPGERPYLPQAGERMGHGRWIFLLASALGSYFTTDRASALYRRHSRALTGDYRPSSSSSADFIERNHRTLLLAEEYALSAAESLDRLASLARGTPESRRFNEASVQYTKAAQAFARRLICYSTAPLSERLLALMSAMARLEHFGPPLYAAGGRGALKDAIAATRILK